MEDLETFYVDLETFYADLETFYAGLVIFCGGLVTVCVDWVEFYEGLETAYELVICYKKKIHLIMFDNLATATIQNVLCGT